MSLINDMLRDLAGQQPLHVTEDDHEQLLADSSLARKQKRKWLPNLVLFFVLLMFLILGQAWFFAQKQQGDSSDELSYAVPVVVEAKRQIRIHTETEREQETEKLQQIAATKADTNDVIEAKNLEVITGDVETADHAEPWDKNTAAIAETSDGENKNEPAAIAPWLKLAALALAQDRLTSPVEDSAWFYYQQVLAIAPQNPQAQQGLRAITGRYLQLISEIMQQASLQQRDISRAQTMLRRARLVTAQDPRLDELEAQLAQIEVGQRARESFPVEVALEARVTTEAQVATASQLATEVQEAEEAREIRPAAQQNRLASTESYSLPAQPTVATPQLQVTRNLEWQDQQAAAQARALMQQGQTERARMQLEIFLQQHGSAIFSSQLLCQIYLDQGELVKAAKLLLDADHWPVIERTRMRAQILIAQGNAAAALLLLETHQAEAENDERYRALLASLYHTLGNYHEAVASYRRMLNIFGEKSAYWLGLALALDSLKQNSSALEAYRRAHEFQPQQAEVNNYIEQRIAALSR